MAIDLGGYESNSFELIEKGWYPMTVTNWEEKETQEGKTYYSVKFTIFGEKHENRNIFENFWLGEGFSEKAISISLGRIKGFFQSLDGALSYESYEDMFNAMIDKPVMGSVGISKSKDPAYDDKNCIYSFKAMKEEELEVDTGEVPF
jgi:hypothetical protein